MFCPFLRKWSANPTQQTVQNGINLIQKCPILNRVFDMNENKNSRNYSIDTSVESSKHTDVELKVCKNVSECFFKTCPYIGTNPNTIINADEMKNNQTLTTDSSKLLKDGTIPRTCAMYNRWKSGSIPNTKSFVLNDTNLLQTSSTPHFDYDSFFSSEVQRKKNDNTYRVFRKVARDANQFPFADDYSFGSKRRVAIWCSNDYLGMSWHPKVQEAAISTIHKHGTGSGGTRNISGNTIFHESMEAELADLHGKPSALIFTSCYVANESILHTLGSQLPELTIVSDSANHASMIQGIRTSRCAKRIYKHNDVQHLESLLAQIPKGAPKLVAFETVHSMTGDICPTKELLDVAELNNALTFADEVHAVGLYGSRGAGIAERDRQMHRIDAITGTLGKAYACIGGYLAGSSDFVDMIRCYASGFIFTTSLPPHILSAATMSVKILKSQEGQQLRNEHQKRVSVVRKQLSEAGLPVIETPSHIVPLHVGDAHLCTEIMKELLHDYGIYIQAINYPTVARGDERLRIAPTPHHTDELTNQLVESLYNVWHKFDLFCKREQTPN